MLRLLFSTRLACLIPKAQLQANLSWLCPMVARFISPFFITGRKTPRAFISFTSFLAAHNKCLLERCLFFCFGFWNTLPPLK